MWDKLRWVVYALALLLGAVLVWSVFWSVAWSQTSQSGSHSVTDINVDKKREATAIRHVKESVAVIEKMKTEPNMGPLLNQAKGIFIMPTYSRFAVGLGGSGGVGILVVRRDKGTWSEPAFFNVGGLNLGVQVGMERGAIGLILMNEKAITSFMHNNVFSLNADSGLTIEDWTKRAQGSIGSGDIVAWSGVKGLFGNAVSIGINDIVFDARRTQAYYHRATTVQEITEGKIHSTQTSGLPQILKFPEPISSKSSVP